jgi:hypothetical protein
LIELLCVWEGRIVLVVIVQPEQSEDLIECIDMRLNG